MGTLLIQMREASVWLLVWPRDDWHVDAVAVRMGRRNGQSEYILGVEKAVQLMESRPSILVYSLIRTLPGWYIHLMTTTWEQVFRAAYISPIFLRICRCPLLSLPLFSLLFHCHTHTIFLLVSYPSHLLR